MQLSLSPARSLEGTARRELGEFRGSTVHAVAGIGQPSRFFQDLRDLGLDVLEHAFPDHHQYQAEDFKALEGPVLMTEKDAVKCTAFNLRDCWAVPVTAQLAPEFYAKLDARLASLAQE